MSATFSELQAMYAAHRVATYPVNPDKTPAVSHYDRIGKRGSAQIAIKFPDATAAGFVAGPRTRLTIIDIDNPDARLATDLQHRFGVTPLQIITPSGGCHLYYRHNGEGRRIRALPDVDILGAGAVVAALSEVPKGHYAIVRGSLEDLDRLPTMRATVPEQRASMVPKGQRNQALFEYCRQTVGACDSLDQLIDTARHWAECHFAEALDDIEVLKTCASVWKYRGGRKLYQPA